MGKRSTRLSYLIHLLATVQIMKEIAARSGRDLSRHLSSAGLAESMHTNPAYIRKLMQIAVNGGLLVSEKGRVNPALAMDASEISLLDIFRIAENDGKILDQDIHINPECGVARELQFSIGEAYGRIQESAQEEMAKITLQDVIDGYYSRAGNERLPD